MVKSSDDLQPVDSNMYIELLKLIIDGDQLFFEDTWLDSESILKIKG